MYARLLPIAAAGFLLAADAHDDAVAQERAKLKGVWQVVAIIQPDGTVLGDDKLKDATLTFTDDKILARVGAKVRAAAYKLDPSKSPMALDMIGTDPDKKLAPFLAIYVLEGDMLKICMCQSGKERPTAFKPNQELGTAVLTLKREKK